MKGFRVEGLGFWKRGLGENKVDRPKPEEATACELLEPQRLGGVGIQPARVSKNNSTYSKPIPLNL